MAVLGALVRTSEAGRSAFGWPYDTETLKAQKAELQTWITEEDRKDQSETAMWWMPVIGVTGQLELALPAIATYTRLAGSPGDLTFARYGLEVRYRFASRTAPPPVIPLARIAVFRDVTDRGTVRIEASAVASYERAGIRVVADLDYIGELRRGADRHELYPSVGVSFGVTRELRLGAEAVAELEGEDSAPHELEWVAAGPNAAWTHGRFWVSGSAPIGMTGIRAAPRVLLGVLF